MSVGISTARDKWLAERRKGIGASDAPTVCGIRSKPTRLQLWLQKRGEIDSDPPTEAMTWGLKLEPLIAEAYTERTGEEIVRLQQHTRHARLPWMLATIDGLTRAGGVVEFKACGSWSARQLPEDGDWEGLPEPWVIQGQHQMAVMGDGCDHVTFAVFADMALRTYRLDRNDAMISLIISMEQEFWGLVESGTPPAEFQAEDTRVLSKHFNRDDGEHVVLNPIEFGEATCGFKDAVSQIKHYEAERDEAKARLLLAMGNAATAECGPYQLKRKLIQVKERVQTIKASQYVRFTVSNGDEA